MLKGKTVLLGITGSIAAYKIAYLASALKKLHADVHVLMTENATNFINPITFETLTGNKCLVDTFDRNFQFQVEHVSIAKKADVVMIAPASANVIGKIANGLADDMLTTTVMACRCQKIFAPAMNTAMYENPIVQDNIKKLLSYGYEVLTPASGYLACGDTGAGKMPEPETLLEYILKEVAFEKDLAGKKVLVTAGPTQEAIDPVRCLTNHSSGKMGYAIAKMAMLRGAEVTLVSGPTAIQPPLFVNVIPVTTARDMFEAVTDLSDQQDIIIKAAAVADYRPKQVCEDKVKKKDDQISIELERTDDILKYLGLHKRTGQFLCGFSMETKDMIGNSRAKLEKKNLDINRLVVQTLSDMEDKIQRYGMDVRFLPQQQDVMICSDGNRLYRVMQNLIDNALKYALEGTRIYIRENIYLKSGTERTEIQSGLHGSAIKADSKKTMQEQKNVTEQQDPQKEVPEQEEDGSSKAKQVVVLSVTNIAKYEIDFTAEEAMERFFRGDKSRQTEGSGLGLAIAKAFTEACGGTLTIDIDGDQFRVNLSFPCI